MDSARFPRIGLAAACLALLTGRSAAEDVAPAHFVLRGSPAAAPGARAFDFDALVRRQPSPSSAALHRRDESPIVLTERDDVPDIAAKRDVGAKAKRQSGQIGVAVPGYGTTYAGGLNTSYIGLIGVGTPPQMLPVTFDLGMPLISVATNGCTSVRG